MSDAEQISERVVRADRQESKDKLCVRMAESGSWCCSYHEGYEDGADAALREANMLREGPDVPTGAPIDTTGVSGVPEQEVNEFLTDVRRPDVATMLDALLCDSFELEFSQTSDDRCRLDHGYRTEFADSWREAVKAAFEALPTETNP